ncbi:protein-tyrosine-phosphatase [Pontibacter sp. KCTC 32443]|uniref:arsenate reductase/protein-tyrosine-phosphatase family protein n=1 Tax=Pontibacter TaxID=323449 RepID=UPI00164E3C55|nr:MULTISPECIES: protein-tyrosine-phosphatase [Pontibacter]MBC5772551.1 protein-tyrosine-phosphatase [Pontibacter sp. KCTC 32443]
MSLNPTLSQTIAQLSQTFDQIPEERKELLNQLTDYIKQKKKAGQNINLVFICTHNSRRSHMAQLWAQAAAANYNIPAVKTYSGGTEATAFYPAAVQAMQELGFEIETGPETINPKYKVKYSPDEPTIEVWSKRFDDVANPKADFAAVMTCSDADDNCPFVPGVEKRIAITYNDPKASDNTPQQAQAYRERALQIGREMLYVFRQV